MMASTQKADADVVNYFVAQTLRIFEDLSVTELEKKDQEEKAAAEQLAKDEEEKKKKEGDKKKKEEITRRMTKAKAINEQKDKISAVRRIYPFSQSQPEWALSLMKESLNIRNVPEIIEFF